MSRGDRLSARALSVLLGASAIGALLSVLAVQWCRLNGWTDPGQHLAMCYSDFSLLFTERGLGEGLFPMLDPVPEHQVMEYPVLISVVAGSLAWLVNTLLPAGQGMEAERILAFYDLNHLAVIGCWVGVVVITALSTARSRRRDALLVALAPGIILSLSINWDMWAVFLGAFALLLWGRGRPGWAGVLIGLGTAMKLYPLFFLGAILVLCLRTGRLQTFAAVIVPAALTWLAVNLPFMLSSFDQWARFWEFSSERGVGFSSMWLALAWTGWSGETFSLLSNGLFLVCCAGITWLGLSAPVRPRMAQLCFLIVASFLLLGKVYSPQFVMWLIPLVVLANPRLRTFLLWQAAEVFHWASVWLISAKITSQGQIGAEHYGFEVLYGVGIAVHMVMVIVLVLQVIGDIRHPERDPVRSAPSRVHDDGDPLAGPLAGVPDRWTLRRTPSSGIKNQETEHA